ncbi:hypothetical protein G6676_01740 [Polynucleobacter paneuropaeus]|nr:hypothetical protein G6676_01740 [Polynucleobacter paneuropaeus]
MLISKIKRLLISLFQKNQFGFISGHGYLSPNQLLELNEMLTNPNQLAIINESYENKFAEVVGNGRAISFASARMAFYVLMDELGIDEGDEVLLTGFTCAVMSNAVLRRGAKPIYADVDDRSYGSSIESIQKLVTQKTKIIVAQHTFGIPCEIAKIVDFGRKNNIFILEDCALSFDSLVDGAKLGNWGDAAIFSTDHTKPINTMIGGILYSQNLDLLKKIKSKTSDIPTLSKQHQKNLLRRIKFEGKYYVPSKYPRLPFYELLYRIASLFSLNKAPTFLDQDTGVPDVNLNNTQDYPYPASLPSFLALLGIYEIEKWSAQRSLRVLILKKILNLFLETGYGSSVPEVYFDLNREIVPLRFIFSGSRKTLSFEALNKVVDTRWIWFKQPVIGAKNGLESLGYITGSCLVSEDICRQIVNLPCNFDESYLEMFIDSLRMEFQLK